MQRSLDRPPLVVSAPGKTILMGEHAAVYGHPALVTAIDRRLHARFEPMAGSGVRLDIPLIGVEQHCSWSSLLADARRAAEAWERYRQAPSQESFARVRGEDPAHLVKVALGETARTLAAEGTEVDGQGLGMRLHLQSDIPLGAGFGSSAAVAAVLVVGLAAWHGKELDAMTLERLTLDIERRQHGMPSGIDSATVLHGGLVWAHRDDGEGLRIEPMTSTPPWLRQIRIFNSGSPAQDTGEVVAAVRRLRQHQRRRFDGAMTAMVEATRELRRGLLAPEPMVVTGLIPLLRRFQAGLEDLGVVPAGLQEVVRQIEAEGGAAKISGAGALGGPGAGSLLIAHPQPERLAEWRFLDPLEPLDIALGAPGVQRHHTA